MNPSEEKFQSPRQEQGLIGQHVGHFQVVRQIGRGSTGLVYEAVHPKLGLCAAVKVLDPRLSEDPILASRFVNEARLVGMLRHPGLIQVFDAGQLPSGILYILMERLEGESLGDRLERCGGKLPQAEALELGRQVAAGLIAAHERGIVHRDLKPDNVFIVPESEANRAKVLDFGLAKMIGRLESVSLSRTQSGVIVGTPLYMAPEQCRGLPDLDGQVDVYALGVMLYQMLSGRPPFEAQTLGDLLVMHITEKAPSLLEAAPRIHPELAQLVDRMLLKAPAERPTMVEVENRLSVPYAEPLPGKPLAPAPLPHRRHPLRRLVQKGPLGVLLPSVLALALFGIFGMGGGGTRKKSSVGTLAGVLTAGVGRGSVLEEALASQERACVKGDRGSCARVFLRHHALCIAGENESCVAVGVSYETGQGTTRDRAQAATYYGKACKGGHLDGCHSLGMLYEAGNGLPRDETRAAGLYEDACNAGFLRSCNRLGVLYQTGRKTPQDPRRTHALFQRACEGEHLIGCYHLASFYLDTDRDKALSLYQRACSGSVTEACIQLGRLHEAEKSARTPELTQMYYQRACDLGDVDGCYRLGYFLQGLGDLHRALPPYRLACDGGHVLSCVSLGHILSTSQGVLHDRLQAAQVYQRACDRGSGLGCFNLGLIYQQEQGDRDHLVRAKDLYQRACDKGEPDGCLNLAFLHEKGLGAEKDDTRAADLYALACSGQSATGCYNLGSMRERGLGTPKDRTLARSAYGRACQLGDGDGCKREVELSDRGP